jgi:hypothetical protein
MHGIQARHPSGNTNLYNGLSGGATPAVVGGPVTNAWGFRACMRYADNGLIGYYSVNATTLGRAGVTNVSTNSQGNEGQWCLLISGEDDNINFNSHTMMGAFLTKSMRGSSPTYGYPWSDPKMNELWTDFQVFNQYMGRPAV